jgi:uncharacterized cupin superfamily protein
MVGEARLEQLEGGLTPVTDGWFVVNVRDAAWIKHDAFGDACVFEGKARFPEVGFTLAVLAPGQPSGMYHREGNQEDFLVLAGECVLIVEEEERRLEAWDFVHCPPGTDHIFAGAGDGPCVIFMTGARRHPEDLLYPPSAVASRHGAAVEEETTLSAEAYARFAKWQPRRRDDSSGLPWAKPD